MATPHVTENPDGTVTHWCPFCGGVSHPATGHAYASGYVACWGCTLDAWRHVKGWTNRKGRRGGPAFYDHVPQHDGAHMGDPRP